MMEIYVVQPGDTLVRIAQRFGVTVEALQQLNQFPDPSRLVVGQAILIPTNAREALRYTVAPGDTLYLLAQLFNTSIQAIASANNIADPNRIQAGMVLVIPGWSQQAYTVRSGDTLYQIAARYGVSVSQIVRVNRISDPSLIYPGQVLSIPQPLTAPVPRLIETFAYFQLLNLSGLERSLTQISAYITYGGIFQYPVNPDGTIVISPNTERAVNILKNFQIRPMPVISNWSANIGFDSDLARTILGNNTIRQDLIANTLNLLQQYGMAGINVDFENMYPEDRALFTNFIRELAAALNPQGYLVTLAVAPKYADLPTASWVGTFDYAALGAAANFIFLMTYEWGWVGGPPMAIAPINQVRRVIQYAVSQIPPEKLIQGVPLYAYNWTLPDTPQNQATTLTIPAVYDLAYNYGAAINYDSVAQSPWFRYTDTAGVQHEVWFEDARSVTAKYQLAREFNLRGVGYWGYVNEPYGFPQNWPVLTEYFEVVKLGS